MDLDEALALVAYLQNRPQTDMTADLRRLHQTAWGTVCRAAQARIDAEQRAVSLPNGERGA